MKSALRPRYLGNRTGIPRNTADFRERANSKLSVNLIAENLTVPTEIYLCKVMYAMLLIFAFTAKEPNASVATGEYQLSWSESATIPFVMHKPSPRLPGIGDRCQEYILQS